MSKRNKETEELEKYGKYSTRFDLFTEIEYVEDFFKATNTNKVL
jgi:hypothetical protein